MTKIKGKRHRECIILLTKGTKQNNTNKGSYDHQNNYKGRCCRIKRQR